MRKFEEVCGIDLFNVEGSGASFLLRKVIWFGLFEGDWVDLMVIIYYEFCLLEIFKRLIVF